MCAKIKYSGEVGTARDEYLAVLKKIKAEKAAAREKWSDASIAEADRSTNKEEAKAAFRAAPWGTPAKVYALNKLAEFCTTIQELREVVHAVSSRIGRNENPAWEKWMSISCIEAHTAKTFEETMEAFLDAPYSTFVTKAREMSFRKLMSFCPTFESLDRIREYFRQLPHDIEGMYYCRREELYKKETGKKLTYPCMP